MVSGGNHVAKRGKFRQQHYPCYRPVITAENAAPVFFILGILFLSAGGVIYQTTNHVRDVTVDYTDCYSDARPRDTCAVVIGNATGETCECRVNFTLAEALYGDVYIYYGLTNYYQNIRAYVRSRDDRQLAGFKVSAANLNRDCSPYRYHDNDAVTPEVIVLPCGSIANSLFNDSITVKYVRDGDLLPVALNKTDIAWESDQRVKFNNPSGRSLKYSFRNTRKPRAWRTPVYNLSDAHSNNGLDNEDFIVWMRVAAFPRFLKLYGRLALLAPPVVPEVAADPELSLPPGEYLLNIVYRYPVKGFAGTKRVMLSTTSYIGGRNNAILYMFVSIGALSIASMLMCVVIHKCVGSSRFTLLSGKDFLPEYAF